MSAWAESLGRGRSPWTTCARGSRAVPCRPTPSSARWAPRSGARPHRSSRPTRRRRWDLCLRRPRLCRRPVSSPRRVGRVVGASSRSSGRSLRSSPWGAASPASCGCARARPSSAPARQSSSRRCAPPWSSRPTSRADCRRSTSSSCTCSGCSPSTRRAAGAASGSPSSKRRTRSRRRRRRTPASSSSLSGRRAAPIRTRRQSCRDSWASSSSTRRSRTSSSSCRRTTRTGSSSGSTTRSARLSRRLRAASTASAF